MHYKTKGLLQGLLQPLSVCCAVDTMNMMWRMGVDGTGLGIATEPGPCQQQRAEDHPWIEHGASGLRTRGDADGKGCGRNFFSRERWREPRFARVPLTLAHLLLFHRRLDG